MWIFWKREISHASAGNWIAVPWLLSLEDGTDCCTQLQQCCLKIQWFSDKFTVLNFGNVSLFYWPTLCFFRLFGRASKVKFLVLWYHIYWRGAVEHSVTMKVLLVLSWNFNLIYSTLQLSCNMNFVVSVK